MRLLIAGTGVAALIDRWRDFVQTSVRALDAVMLDAHAPAALRGIWADLSGEQDLGDQTATVYHFGYDAAADMHRPFIYRSTNNFDSETQMPGFGVKPAPLGEFEGPTSIEEIIAVADRIRAEQATLPSSERITSAGNSSSRPSTTTPSPFKSSTPSITTSTTGRP
jgi:hypothetical protein